MTGDKIFFRPHHFLCTLGFKGMGYSPNFVRNYKSIAAKLKKYPDTVITVSEYNDSICAACPHQINQESCTEQQLILKLDQAHTKILGLKPGQEMSWNDAKDLLKQKMTLANFDQACEGCAWKEHGVCKSALEELLQHHNTSL